MTSLAAPRLVMTSGTSWATIRSRSASIRLLLLCTMKLTP